MKSILIIASMLLSFSTLANHETNELEMEQIVLDKGMVQLGFLEGEMGMPLHKDLAIVRTDDTPKKVTFLFNYTQVEMICAHRIPDAFTYVEGNRGGTSTEVGPTDKSVNKYRRRGYGYGYGHGYGHGHGGNTYNYYGPDRNFLGICQRWTEMETEKSARVGIYFKKRMKSAEETLKVSIVRKDRHSTSFYFDVDMVTPSRKYKKVRMNSRAVMFK